MEKCCDYKDGANSFKAAFRIMTAPIPIVRQAGTAGMRGVRTWLIVVAALVVCTLMVGGATRLTESGLSIVEWKPVTGTIPPLTDAEWSRQF